MNITETCDMPEEGDDPVLNLVIDTEVTVVSAPDNGFLEQALEHTQEIKTDEIEIVYADDVYHSTTYQEYFQSEDDGIDLVLTAM